MLFAEVPPIGIAPIKIIQIKIPKVIPKKQANLFLPNFGFCRPTKYNKVTDNRSPKLRAIRIGMSRNSASIFWSGMHRVKPS